MPDSGISGPSESDYQRMNMSFNQRLLAAIEEQNGHLSRLARDMAAVRSDFMQVVNYIHEAESEVPERIRRFVTYYHDIHDVKYIYEEGGLDVPKHILREIERCDDRMRHITEDAAAAGGAFEKVRREMTKREGNRWDHGAMLPKQENGNETRSSPDGSVGTKG